MNQKQESGKGIYLSETTIMINPTPGEVKEIFDNYFIADLNLWAEFSKYISVRSFRKNEIIKDYDHTEKHINILVRGSVGLFVWGHNKDICINLYYENHLFSDYLSFLKQQPTAIKSESLEDTVVWSIHHTDLNSLYEKSMYGVKIGKAISDAMFIRKQSEQINLLTLTPTERYLKLIAERPEIFQRTPLKIVASYLGLTAESLSRIRKRIP